MLTRIRKVQLTAILVIGGVGLVGQPQLAVAADACAEIQCTQVCPSEETMNSICINDAGCLFPTPTCSYGEQCTAQGGGPWGSTIRCRGGAN